MECLHCIEVTFKSDNYLHNGALRGIIFFPLCIPNNACVVRVFPFSLCLPIFDLESTQRFCLKDRVSEFDGHEILSASFVSSRL